MDELKVYMYACGLIDDLNGNAASFTAVRQDMYASWCLCMLRVKQYSTRFAHPKPDITNQKTPEYSMSCWTADNILASPRLPVPGNF